MQAGWGSGPRCARGGEAATDPRWRDSGQEGDPTGRLWLGVRFPLCPGQTWDREGHVMSHKAPLFLSCWPWDPARSQPGGQSYWDLFAEWGGIITQGTVQGWLFIGEGDADHLAMLTGMYPSPKCPPSHMDLFMYENPLIGHTCLS